MAPPPPHPHPTAANAPLHNRVIALPETRDLDVLAAMLQEAGATPRRCPMVQIVDAADSAPVEAWLRELIAGRFDDLIFLTGEGLRRLLALAGRLSVEPQVIQAIANARKITRGPKPAKALTQIGLRPDLAAPIPTTDGIIAALSTQASSGALQRRRIGLQLYGQEPNLPLTDFLARAGAIVRTVAPYQYIPAADDHAVAQLIQQMAAGAIDVIAFTSAAQVQRLWEVAASRGLDAQLASGLSNTRVAAVGPVVASELIQRGVKPSIQPSKNFSMRSLVKQIVEAFSI